jgi:enoyl-CoA hydratase/carnithine racemase
MIRLDREGPIAWITLDRPDRLNAITEQMLGDLMSTLDGLRTSDARVVVLRGAGRAFSAGMDISSDSAEIASDARPKSTVDDREQQAAYIDSFRTIWEFPLPVIAAVHGYCLGGASQLCVFCDLTVVAEDAVIGASPALPTGGGFISPLWAHLVGPKRAKQMSFVAGERIDGKTAVLWGWANFAVPAAELEDRVRELAVRIARTPAPILRMKKLSINRVAEMNGFLTSAYMGAETNVLLHATPEVDGFHDLIRQHGLKEAIRMFEEGAAGG